MTWEMINGYRNPYRINDDGEVQRMTTKGEWVAMKARLSHERAHVTLLTKDGGHRKVPVVRLMDDAFLGGRAKREGLFITHKNGAKMDCAFANLELVTPGESGKRHGGISNRRAVVRYDNNGRTKQLSIWSLRTATFLNKRSLRQCVHMQKRLREKRFRMRFRNVLLIRPKRGQSAFMKADIRSQ